MSVDVYINIVHIVPTLGGVICKLLFSLVLYIAIGGICISCSVSLGPPGPVYGGLYLSWCLDWYCISCQQLGGCILHISCLVSRVGGYMSVGVYNGIVYIMPTIWGVVCKLFFTLVLYISCQ